MLSKPESLLRKRLGLRHTQKENYQPKSTEVKSRLLYLQGPSHSGRPRSRGQQAWAQSGSWSGSSLKLVQAANWAEASVGVKVRGLNKIPSRGSTGLALSLL
jgi:hypothetical protein